MITTKDQLIDSLKKAVYETFEGLAFVEFDETKILEKVPNFDDGYLLTNISIDQPVQCKMTLSCSQQFANETYEAVTGEFLDGNGNEAVIDSLNEIVNTLAGRFVASLLEEDEDFILGLPNTEKYTDSSLEHWTSGSPMLLEFTTMQEKLFCLFRIEKNNRG